ncbi:MULTISPECIES: four helix bundle protein [Rhodohalobacter]|uniref:Four helix bundle protein n=1 Tax=Rhodohalobacter barkolensis TaxID=2053187 RepID=A0A2N0VEB1_9BACT|nr:four helix bundle protein [Rhodohalobacter barkolensis]PKD42527.1 four helix bundle protein [Rhodohalobacter barkolensis]
MKIYDLEDRLIDFAVHIIKVAEQLPKNYTGNHLGKQIIRSGTAPALNYGEAQGAESRKDFIHKMKISLKELRETFINLKIIKKSGLIVNYQTFTEALKECNELISIFVKSVKTAEKT